MKLSLIQLSDNAGVPGRTVRYYIQKGLLPPPEGSKRGSYYTETHLAELLRIKQWQDAGLSLDAIEGLLRGRREAPIEPARPGTVQVRSHLIVAAGIELSVCPEQAGLTQAELRELFRAVKAFHQQLLQRDHGDDDSSIDQPPVDD